MVLDGQRLSAAFVRENVARRSSANRMLLFSRNIAKTLIYSVMLRQKRSAAPGAGEVAGEVILADPPGAADVVHRQLVPVDQAPDAAQRDGQPIGHHLQGRPGRG